MPLPWKKAKCTRISRLVSDHLHSPKRGGSLVVEAGFPTSLIDLFVKNRDRLKKPSKKKRPEAASPDPISIPPRPSSTFVVSPSSSTLATPSSTRPPNTPQVPPSARGSPSATPQRYSSEQFSNEIAVVQEVGLVGDGIGKGNGECADANRVFMAILKIFFVVVLALGTKKLVVGITMSAFLLLFMEYAGKHLCRLVKPCADTQKSLPCLIGRFLCFVGINWHKLMMEEDQGFKAPVVQEETTPVVSVCSSLIEGHNMNDPIQEIQVLPPNSDSGSSTLMKGHKMNNLIREIQIAPPSPSLVPPPPPPEIQYVKYEFNPRSGKEKWAEMGKKEEVFKKEEAYTSDALDVKSRRTRGKIRSKIKKLVKKKLHGGKKKRLESKDEASISGVDKKVNTCEEREHAKDGQQCELECDDNSSSISSERNGDPVNVEDAICSSGEFSRAEIEGSIVRETERNSGYLIIFVILLVGLVGGRVVALALTLSWYLLLKSAGPLQRCLNL